MVEYLTKWSPTSLSLEQGWWRPALVATAATLSVYALYEQIK